MEGMAMVTARESNVLTVATIRAGRNKAIEYLFNERQCIFLTFTQHRRGQALTEGQCPLLTQSGHATKGSRSEGCSVSGGFAGYAVRSLFPLRAAAELYRQRHA